MRSKTATQIVHQWRPAWGHSRLEGGANNRATATTKDFHVDNDEEDNNNVDRQRKKDERPTISTMTKTKVENKTMIKSNVDYNDKIRIITMPMK